MCFGARHRDCTKLKKILKLVSYFWHSHQELGCKVLKCQVLYLDKIIMFKSDLLLNSLADETIPMLYN